MLCNKLLKHFGLHCSLNTVAVLYFFAVQTGRLTASDSLPISSQDKDDTSTTIFNEETGDIPRMPQQQVQSTNVYMNHNMQVVSPKLKNMVLYTHHAGKDLLCVFEQQIIATADKVRFLVNN